MDALHAGQDVLVADTNPPEAPPDAVAWRNDSRAALRFRTSAHRGVIAWVCARPPSRGGRRGFASSVKLSPVENDYELLGRFEGRSTLTTPHRVINRLYWTIKPTASAVACAAEARRLGPVACARGAPVRDGLNFEERAE